MSFQDRIPGYLDRVESALERWLPPAATHPTRLHTAIRYAVLGEGKRVRPLIVYAAGEWLGIGPERLDGIAVAIELVHAYSLVHDDLPAMDNDDSRHGRPTTHLAFDEATAILVGDALQAHAYHVLATDPGLDAAPQVRRQLVVDLAAASGSEGMTGGQAMDMAATRVRITPAGLEDLYERKTGRLLRAAAIMPCRLRGEPDARWLDAADGFGRALGLAFQVADDLLDLDRPAAIIGKPQRSSDLRNSKATFPGLIGAEETRRRFASLRSDTHAALAGFGPEADALRWISDYVIQRDR